MTNAEIAQIFSKTAEILAIQNANRFRIRAYEKAAVTIEGLPREVADIYLEKDRVGLTEIGGIGEDLADRIEELLKTGKLKMLRDLQKEIPAGVLEVMDVEGMGPKKTKFVWEKFRVQSLMNLERLAKSGRLSKIKGWGEKSVQNILRGIELVRKFGERMPLGKAWPLAESIIVRLKKTGLVDKIEIAGSLRRKKETIGDIDILATSKKPAQLIEAFTKLSEVKEVEVRGPTKCTVFFKNGLDCDLRVLEPDSFGAGLYYFTGSKQHNVHTRTLAVQRGYTINEYGVYKGTKEKKGRRVAAHTEEDVFRVLGLPFIPPELREDTGEVEAAQKGKLPKLITQKDIQGDLHCHSDFSDGTVSMVEMIASARRAGRKYIALTDHASTMGIVRGIKTNNIGRYIKMVRTAAKKVPGIQVLAGSEVDILADGQLYLPDSALKQLDWINASIHLNFKQSREVATRRLLKVMDNPYVSCIGHTTTRLISQRPAMEFDFATLFKKAKQKNITFEINASWMRLDLSDVHARQARDAGVALVINSDAHEPSEFDTRFGISTARRAWCEPKNILNTLPWLKFEKWLKNP